LFKIDPDLDGGKIEKYFYIIVNSVAVAEGAKERILKLFKLRSVYYKPN
jgi:hypothetical protein